LASVRVSEEALFGEIQPLGGQDARYDALIQHTERLIRAAVEDEFLARPMTESVARLLQGAELLRHSPKEVVDVFLSTRGPGASGTWGSHYGTLAFASDHAAARTIVRRASVD
jgi:putative acyl-CoA dehydrogenase